MGRRKQFYMTGKTLVERQAEPQGNDYSITQREIVKMMNKELKKAQMLTKIQRMAELFTQSS